MDDEIKEIMENYDVEKEESEEILEIAEELGVDRTYFKING